MIFWMHPTVHIITCMIGYTQFVYHVLLRMLHWLCRLYPKTQSRKCGINTNRKKTLYGSSRQPLNISGHFWTFTHNSKTRCFFVVNNLKTNLLFFFVALGLAIRADALGTDNLSSTDILKQFPSVFLKLKIHLKPGAVPHSLLTPRHVPLPLDFHMGMWKLLFLCYRNAIHNWIISQAHASSIQDKAPRQPTSKSTLILPSSG